jgi:hypothetical protein
MAKTFPSSFLKHLQVLYISLNQLEYQFLVARGVFQLWLCQFLGLVSDFSGALVAGAGAASFCVGGFSSFFSFGFLTSLACFGLSVIFKFIWTISSVITFPRIVLRILTPSLGGAYPTPPLRTILRRTPP